MDILFWIKVVVIFILLSVLFYLVTKRKEKESQSNVPKESKPMIEEEKPVTENDEENRTEIDEEEQKD